MAFFQEIRYCIVPNPSLLGDGICHNFDKYNTAGCEFDNGDCEEFNKKYPNCKAKYDVFLGDGKCDGPLYNTIECGFDEGDCDNFNKQYPDCKAEKPLLVGNGKCDEGEYNTMECGWDGNDCLGFTARYPNCTAPIPSQLGDGTCDGGVYNTLDCGWDNGDCDDFNKRYPNCSVHYPKLIGDGFCDIDENTEECGFDGGDCSFLNKKYPNCTHWAKTFIGNNICNTNPSYYSGLHTEECGFDGGDCDGLKALYPDCPLSLLGKLDNGLCDGMSNIEECGWDNGACVDFNLNYPNCKVHEAYKIGNDFCDIGEYHTEECGWDGGDCLDFFAKFPNCSVDKPYYIGNGWCNAPYNTTECGFDGGDCIPLEIRYPNCTVPVDEAHRIGDSNCDGGLFNTAECGWEDGDCDDHFNQYPACDVSNPWRVGNGECNSGEYNTLECGWDGGDCEAFNEKYPGCNTTDKTYLMLEEMIGDGKCHGGVLYSEECGWEEGDCDDHFTRYPNCSVTENMHKIGNGNCDYGTYNTFECDYDGGDCAVFNKMYPLGCYGVDLLELGDGICQHNTEGCNYDDGDCDDFRAQYPNCTAAKPYRVGDGNCDEEYNTVECRNDGGDCEATDKGFLLVNGEKVFVNEYQRDTRIYSIIQTCSSLISLIASIGIMWILYRSVEKLGIPFHRLLFGMCAADACASFAIVFSTLPAPDQFDVIWNARGNKASCQAQGFFVFLGSMAAPLYNCSLCIYYLIVVTYRKGKDADTYIKGKIEFMLHAVPISFSLVGAVTILSMDAFHPNMTYCFIGSDPTCNNLLDCAQTHRSAITLFMFFSAGPYIFLPFIIVGTMTLMYRAVGLQEKKLKKYGATVLDIRKKAGRTIEKNNAATSVAKEKDRLGTKSSLKQLFLLASNTDKRLPTRSNNTRRQSRAVMNRAFSYSFAFLCTYLFPMIISIRTLRNLESNHTLSILARLLFPLQGFLNFLVFINPKVIAIKNSSREAMTWYGAFVMAIQSRGQKNQHLKIKKNIRSTTGASSHMNSKTGTSTWFSRHFLKNEESSSRSNTFSNNSKKQNKILRKSADKKNVPPSN